MNRRLLLKGLVASSILPATAFTTPTVKGSLSKKRKFPKKLIKPRRLKKGDTIGLIAPSSPISEERLLKTVNNIERLGFKLKFDRNIVLSQYGYLAGSDQSRANDVNRMFADKTIKGIWCIRGGYGSGRILPLLNYKVIKKNPKVLIGYSDITALIQGIFLNTGLVCFHGPAGASDYPEYTTKHVERILTNPMPTNVIEFPKANLEQENNVYKPFAIRDGAVEGQLIGGNLTLVTSLMGTPYDIDMDNKLIFLEDIGEKPYRIDRMLTQMLLAGKFRKAKGIILGVFNGCDSSASNSLTLAQTLNDRLSGLGIPVIYGLSFGHISNQFTLPLGIRARLDVRAKQLTLLEPAVV